MLKSKRYVELELQLERTRQAALAHEQGLAEMSRELEIARQDIVDLAEKKTAAEKLAGELGAKIKTVTAQLDNALKANTTAKSQLKASTKRCEAAENGRAAAEKRVSELKLIQENHLQEIALLSQIVFDYQDTYPDLEENAIDAPVLRHLNAVALKLLSNKDSFPDAVLGLPSLIDQMDLLTQTPLFDPEWYRQHARLPIRNDISPELHYLMLGTYAGDSPGPEFDTMQYYRDNIDVAQHGFCALTHYLMFGRAENRQAQADYHSEQSFEPMVAVGGQ